MLHPLRRALASLAVTVGLSFVAGLAAARPLEVPTVPIAAATEAEDLRVAVGTDGAMVFAWRSGGSLWTQRFSQTGTALAAPMVIAAASDHRLSADTRGGYLLAYTRESAGQDRLYGWRLDAAGAPVGAEIAVDQSTDDVRFPEVMGLPVGAAFVWQQGTNCWLRRYDPDGTALGDAVVVGDNGFGFPLAAGALDDGGIVVMWHDPSIHTFLGRTFDADGSPRFGAVFLPSLLDVTAVAATSDGGFAALGVVQNSTLRLVRFDAAFQVLAAHDVLSLPTGDTPIATFARDAAGRWLVVYATAHHDPGYVALLGYLAPAALPVGADLAPLDASFPLSPDGTARVVTALLPSGSFVNAWSTVGPPGSARAYANVVSLCTPDIHVCGDGTLDPRCEECDDGVGNDDALPDACRTTCLLPSCGDGTTDTAEGCDDGDPSPCDGCDDACEPVAGLACGDGILVEGCGAQCDDGNTIAGDGCAPQCTLERIPGGGSAKTDCLAEWIVANPTNDPLLDGRGRIRRTQRCVDDDPRCDADGGIAGSCTFRVRVCAGNTDVAGCSAPELATWALTKPTIGQAARRPELAAVRAAFAGVPGALSGTSAVDFCTSDLDVVVPRKGSGVGSLTLAATATTIGAARDKDSLKLICLPH